MVEEGGTVEVAHLRALVADHGIAEMQAVKPGQRARKGPPGASDHVHAGGTSPVERGHVAIVDLEVERDDGPVQVKRQQLEGYRWTFSASGLTRFGGRPPRIAVARLRAATAHISERVRVEALAMCGASTELCVAIRPGCTCGSFS